MFYNPLHIHGHTNNMNGGSTEIFLIINIGEDVEDSKHKEI